MGAKHSSGGPNFSPKIGVTFGAQNQGHDLLGERVRSEHCTVFTPEPDTGTPTGTVALWDYGATWDVAAERLCASDYVRQQCRR